MRAVEPLGGTALCSVVEAGLDTGWHTLPGKYALLEGPTLGLVLDRVLALLGVEGRSISPPWIARPEALSGSLRLVQEHP